jgi:alkane 1-monooxygenase
MVVAGNMLGGYYTFLNLIYGLVIMTFLERYFGREDKLENQISGIAPDMVIIWQSITHIIAILSLLYGVYSGAVQSWFIISAAASTGLYAGQIGIVNAHELIHRKQYLYRLMGIINLALVNYSHFYVEHIRGHHKYVGTPRDPATALYGENYYQFLLRTIPGQYKSAWQLEKERLQKKNQSAWSLNNFVLRASLIEMIIISLLCLISLKLFVAYIVCSFTSIALLEYVNYIEHYGLVRKEGQRVTALHSWQSDFTYSRYNLIELSRHADHHYYASKPYHTLISYDESPVLPYGYFGCFYYVLIPPLWFKLIHPRLQAISKQVNA